MYLVFDTETTDLPQYKLAADHPLQARVIQLACLLLDKGFRPMGQFCALIQPNCWHISEGAKAAHGIDEDTCARYGVPIEDAIAMFERFVLNANYLVAHNIKFDMFLVQSELTRLARVSRSANMQQVCTMLTTTPLCKLPGRYGQYKWPKLSEAYEWAFKEELKDAHDALVDCKATARLLQALVQRQLLILSTN